MKTQITMQMRVDNYLVERRRLGFQLRKMAMTWQALHGMLTSVGEWLALYLASRMTARSKDGGFFGEA